MEEEEGFEPPRALTPLSVFKTDPFNQTWVFLRMHKNKYIMVPYDLSIIFKIFSSLVMYCKEGKKKWEILKS